MSSFNNQQIDELLKQEWLVSNGLGGYAASSICWANTRRGHGLLVTNSPDHPEKRVLVSKIEECMAVHRDTCIEFSTNQYPGVIHPRGFQYLHTFDRNPFPETVFRIENQEVTKSIFMVYGSDTTVLKYHNSGYNAYQLSLMPLLVNRSSQALFREDARFDFYYERFAAGLKIHSHYGSEPLYFGFPNGVFHENRQWFYNLEYRKDQRKGMDYQEDAYGLGRIKYYLQPGEKTYLVMSTEPAMLTKDPELLELAEVERLKNLNVLTPVSNAFTELVAVE